MAKRDRLTNYRSKRDFKKTHEPEGAPRRAGKKLRYLIQKHAARREHYDFRLEWDGALLSWAVPKGPSENPDDKRLAVHVEDHPVEYGSFEGTIPQGEYGGGTVMLWDRGTWAPDGDVDAGLEKGKLSFELFGERLHGHWALVRLRARSKKDKDNWLLIKELDEHAQRKGKLIVARETTSVTTGRTMDEIAKGSKVWHSNKPKAAKAKPVKTKPLKKSQQVPSPASSSRSSPRWLMRRRQAPAGCTKSNSTAIAPSPRLLAIKWRSAPATGLTGPTASTLWSRRFSNCLATAP
jgi:bifunctional non-homologous end joining protein LigD